MQILIRLSLVYWADGQWGEGCECGRSGVGAGYAWKCCWRWPQWYEMWHKIGSAVSSHTKINSKIAVSTNATKALWMLVTLSSFCNIVFQLTLWWQDSNVVICDAITCFSLEASVTMRPVVRYYSLRKWYVANTSYKTSMVWSVVVDAVLVCLVCP